MSSPLRFTNPDDCTDHDFTGGGGFSCSKNPQGGSECMLSSKGKYPNNLNGCKKCANKCGSKPNYPNYPDDQDDQDDQDDSDDPDDPDDPDDTGFKYSNVKIGLVIASVLLVIVAIIMLYNKK
jgi:hypothetical protein